MITIIFEDGIDFYFARQRVTEKLGQASTFLPPGVVPYLAPDATALGQIFWYTVEAEPDQPDRLRHGCGRSTSSTSPRSSTPRRAWPRWPSSAARRWSTRSTCDPKHLRAYGITLGELYAAVGQEQHAGRRRRHPEEQRRVHRPRRRLDQGQAATSKTRSSRRSTARRSTSRRWPPCSSARSSAAASTRKTATKSSAAWC